jgi:hypothetical protein
LVLIPVIFILNLIFLNQFSYKIAFIAEPIIGILSIFITPLVFLLRERKRPIILGFQCIVGNASDSIFLIGFVLLTFVINLLYTNYGAYISDFNRPAFFMVGLIVGFISMLIDFLVFIVAALILNNKLLRV